jgi:alkanesulfonate monooxygenase SsuD/methylene tetrahydromethanopterin reductase-like flavin-dependent oxidoreductase (luciferase family)
VRVGEDVEEEEHVVSGPPGEVAARLNDFRKMGFSAMNFMLSGPDTTEQAERLAREVIPELRAMAYLSSAAPPWTPLATEPDAERI